MSMSVNTLIVKSGSLYKFGLTKRFSAGITKFLILIMFKTSNIFSNFLIYIISLVLQFVN